MKFPSSLLEEIRQRLMLSQNIASYTNLKRKGNHFLGLCPFHKEKTPSFTVDDQKGSYHCFGCGAHGDIIRFHQEMRNFSFPEAVRYLASLAGLHLAQEENAADSSVLEAIRNVLQQAALWFEQKLYQPEGQQARDYLVRRGILPQTWKTFQLGWTPGNNALSSFLQQQGFSKDLLRQAGLIGESEERYDRFRNRLMFPIKNIHQKVIGFGGRLIGEGQPKYLNSPETLIFKKGENLYNLSKAVSFQRGPLSSFTPLVVVEGYIDVISVFQAGFPQLVSSLGTALTEKQIQLLWQYAPEPVICFDGDDAGRKAAERTVQRVLPLLKPGYSLNFVFLPTGLDPDNFIHQQGLEQWQQIINEALPLHTVLWNNHQQGYPIDTPERLSLSHKVLNQLLHTIADPAVRHHYITVMGKNWQRLTFSYAKKKSPQKIPLVKHKALNSNGIQQRILLAVPLNHPELLSTIFEDFTKVEFSVPQYEMIRQELISVYTEKNTLDREQLNTHLTKKGYSDVLQQITGKDLLLHAAFAHPKASLEQALQGWQETVQWYQEQCIINEQTALAAALLGEDLNLESWERLKNLKYSALQVGNKT
jgi:DNA primase